MKLPDDVDARLRHEAARQGKTLSALTREAIETHLGMSRPREPQAKAAGRSGHSDITERIDEILKRELRQHVTMAAIP